MQSIKNENSFPISKNLIVSYFAVLLAAAVLYIATCAPGPLWQDGGMYQYRIWHSDIEGKLGLALSHPLYHIIGIGVKYIRLGEFAYRVNLISAIAAAVAVANLFLLVRLWLGKNLPAVIAAVTFALSWTTWQFACIAEVYTLYAALFLAELIMLFQYIKTRRIGFLYLLALFNGLAIANHMWAVIALACYLVFLATLLAQKQISLKHLGIIAGLWVIGAAPYEYLIIKNVVQSGDFTATLASAFFGSTWRGDVLNTSLSAKLVKENLILMAYNFSTPNVIFFFAGLYGLKRVSPSRSFRNIILALLILFFVFAFRYTVPDRYAFFMPFYCLVCILIGVGFDLLVARPNRKVLGWIVVVLALLPIPTYVIAPAIAQETDFKLPTKRNIPYRNDYTWFLQPWRTGCRGPEKFAEEVFNTVGGDAVVYADGTTVYALLCAQEVKKGRSDIRIVSFYVVSKVPGYCPQFLLERYEFKQAGAVWKVLKRP
ncbi:MAG: protein O-mannosyl-transferase family [Planctomycetota bacterium]|jgi:hypothetical protein